MSDLKPQLLLTGRPTCTRCMHSHMVETVTGREKTPLEYHCGYCGNYAIVGINTRWPFMVAVKSESKSVRKVVQRDHDDAGSSPLQLGESLVKASANYSTKYSKPAQQAVSKEEKPAEKCKPKEEKTMATCKTAGCDKWAAVQGYCNEHFRTVFGLTANQYTANKTSTREDPCAVAERIKRADLKQTAERVQETKERFEKACEDVREQKTAPAKPGNPVQAAIPLIQLFLYPELLDELTAAAKKEWRTPEGQAAYLIEKALRG